MNGRRRGFALLAVLWAVVALTAVTAGAIGRTRSDASITGNHVAHLKGRWAAESCLAAAQSDMEAVLRGSASLQVPGRDTLFFANGARCIADAYDPGTRVNAESLPALAAALDSAMADTGALFTPYGDGRINLNAADLSLVGLLPSVREEAVRTLADARSMNRPLRDLQDLAGRMSPAGRTDLFAQFGDLIRMTSFQTSSVVVQSRGWVEGYQPAITIEQVFVAAGPRVAVVRRRVRS